MSAKNGASEGIRTLDVHLGKVMLYQTELRSQQSQRQKLRESTGIASSFLNRRTGRDQGRG